MHKASIDDLLVPLVDRGDGIPDALGHIVMGILSIAVSVVIVLFIGYYAAEKKEKEQRVEFTKVEPNTADKLLLCATRIHILEREVDMLKGRVDDLEINARYGNADSTVGE